MPSIFGYSATWPAATPSRSDVVAAIAMSSDGDIVTIPAGTSHWVTNLTISKAITLLGAGTNSTVILDDIPDSDIGLADLSSLIKFQTQSNKFYCIGGIYFSNSPVRTIAFGTGMVLIRGDSRAVRVHDCFFGNTTNRLRTVFWYDNTAGCVDHCFFLNNTRDVDIEHGTWNGEAGGFGAWDSDNTMGTTNVVCIEDCYFNGNIAITDSDHGGHYCVRHCLIDGGHPDSHEMGENYMAVRNVEIYNNIFTNQNGNVLMLSLRGGTAVCFSNQNWGASSNSGSLVGLYSYRNTDSYPTWGALSGTNGWDNCSASPTETGTFNGADGQSSTMTDTTKTWTVNQFVGCVVQNLAQQNMATGGNITGHAFGSVSGNTANTLTFYTWSHDGNQTYWTNGNPYRIYYVTNAFNAPGMGKGDFISNPPTSPHWLNEQIEPVYTWGNTPANLTSFGYYGNTRAGVHYFDNTPKPVYIPLVYPHPLVQTNAVVVAGNVTTFYIKRIDKPM